MTPEDLTAIGIKKPHDREKIKQHIDALQLPDSLPNYVPVSNNITIQKFLYGLSHRLLEIYSRDNMFKVTNYR